MKERIFKRFTAILLTVTMLLGSIATPVLAEDYSEDGIVDEVRIQEIIESGEEEPADEAEVPVEDAVGEQSFAEEEQLVSEQVPEDEIFAEGEDEPETLVGEEGEMTWNDLQQKLSVWNDEDGAIEIPNNITAPDDAGPLTNNSGNKVTIDLKGHTIDRGLSNKEAVDNGCVFYLDRGTLDIKDSVGGGIITGGNNSRYGGAVWLDGGGSFILESGTITGNKARQGGAVGADGANSCFRLGDDGEITGNTATKAGGAVYIDGGTGVIEGGAISGNTVTDGDGGGLYVQSGTCNISGGTITGNQCSADGGGIYLNNGTSLYMSGGAVINISENTGNGNLYLSDGVAALLDSAITKGSSIYVTTQTGPAHNNPITIASNYNSTKCFKSDNDNYLIKWNGVNETIDLKIPDTVATWDELQAQLRSCTTTEYDEDDNAYQIIRLSADVTADSDDTPLYYEASQEVIIDLCGYTIDRNLTEGTSNGHVLKITGNRAHIIIRDSKGGGKITGGNCINGEGGCIVVDNNGTLTLEGGTITGNKSTKCNGGAVSLHSGNFNMLGGTISGNKTYSGGGVYINSGTFTMKGGLITENIAEGPGGGVYSDGEDEFRISGIPKITGNKDNYGNSSNVHCWENKIVVEGPLEDGAHIDVDPSAKEGIITTGYAEYCGDVQPDTYFATDNAAFLVYQDSDSKEVAIENGHNAADEPEWEWADDYKFAVAKMLCANCGAELWSEEISGEGIVGPELDPITGKLNYTATVTHDNMTYSNVKSVYPNYQKQKVDWADDYSSAEFYLSDDTNTYGKVITTENIEIRRQADSSKFTITATATLDDKVYIETLYNVESYTANFECYGGEAPSAVYLVFPVSQTDGKAHFKSPGIDAFDSELSIPDGAEIAGWKNNETVYKIGDNVVIDCDTDFTAAYASKWSAVNAALQEKEYVRLYSDIQPEEGDTYLYIPSGKKVTLDLNGFTADRGLTTGVEDGFVIKVDGSLILKNGTVKGGYNSGNGGAIYVSGVLYFEKAELKNCHALNGGGVYLETGAKAMMMSGQITYNEATEYGGGVYVSENSKFSMTSVKDDYEQFAAEDTTGTDNSGTDTEPNTDEEIDDTDEKETTVGDGGGDVIGIPEGASVIENNIAGIEGGGIYINKGQGTAYFNGVSQVINNTKGTEGLFNNLSAGGEAAGAGSLAGAISIGPLFSVASALGISAKTGEFVIIGAAIVTVIGIFAYVSSVFQKDTKKKEVNDEDGQRKKGPCTHAVSHAEWLWNTDYSQVKVSIVCDSCGTIDYQEVSTVKTVNSDTKVTHYEASVNSNNKTYTDTKDVAPYKLTLKLGSDEIVELLAHGINENAYYTLALPPAFQNLDYNPICWVDVKTNERYDIGETVSVETDTELELERESKKSCTVYYKPGAENVKGQMQNASVPEDASYPLSPCTYERDDYDFSSWSVEVHDTGEKYLKENAKPGTVIQVSVDLDAVAQWKSHWTILNEALKKETDISRSSTINAQAEDVDLTVPETMTTTLDMNGNKLDRKMTVAAEKTGRAMTISGDLTLKKATVTGAMNSGDGGGVMVENNGKFTIEDVVIEKNSTTNGRGAGIYVNKDSKVNISGLITIQDNKRIVNKDEKTGEAKDPVESTENVYLAKEAKLTVKDKLSDDTKIGISMEEPGVFTSGLKDKGGATNFTSDDPDYTVGINKDGEAYLIKKPKFKTYSLLLAGNIGVNFFLELADNSGMDYSKSYMEFKVNGKTQKANYNKEFKDQNGKGYYGFTCKVSSIQMAEEITAVYHYGDDNKLTVEKKYSIDQYIQKFEKVKSSYDKVTVDFVHALADYGHYIQPYLSAQNGWTIGKDYKEMATHFKKEGDFDFNTIKEKVAPYAIVRDYGTSGVTCTYSLDLQSGTIIKVYLDVSGVTGSWSATLDGKSVKKTKSGTKYVVQIKNVPSHKLQTSHTIVVKTAAGNATIKVSALSYCDGMFNKDGATDVGKRAVSTIYYYNQAARAYIKVHPIK